MDAWNFCTALCITPSMLVDLGSIWQYNCFYTPIFSSILYLAIQYFFNVFLWYFQVYYSQKSPKYKIFFNFQFLAFSSIYYNFFLNYKQNIKVIILPFLIRLLKDTWKTTFTGKIVDSVISKPYRAMVILSNLFSLFQIYLHRIIIIKKF